MLSHQFVCKCEQAARKGIKDADEISTYSAK
jgi:hypothetical protein